MPILYSTGCPQCQVLKKKLDNAKIEYSIVTDINIMQEKGFISVPILEVGDKCMTFIEANNWIKEQ